MHDFAVKI